MDIPSFLNKECWTACWLQRKKHSCAFDALSRTTLPSNPILSKSSSPSQNVVNLEWGLPYRISVLKTIPSSFHFLCDIFQTFLVNNSNSEYTQRIRGSIMWMSFKQFPFKTCHWKLQNLSFTVWPSFCPVTPSKSPKPLQTQVWKLEERRMKNSVCQKIASNTQRKGPKMNCVLVAWLPTWWEVAGALCGNVYRSH